MAKRHLTKAKITGAQFHIRTCPAGVDGIAYTGKIPTKVGKVDLSSFVIYPEIVAKSTRTRRNHDVMIGAMRDYLTIEAGCNVVLFIAVNVDR